ncbi:unnamed protein product, partial [Owenia fusiformis]
DTICSVNLSYILSPYFALISFGTCMLQMLCVMADDGYNSEYQTKPCKDDPTGRGCPQFRDGQVCGRCIKGTMTRVMNGNCRGDLLCTCPPVAEINGQTGTARCQMPLPTY